MTIPTRATVLTFQPPFTEMIPPAAVAEMINQLLDIPYVSRTNRTTGPELVRSLIRKERQALYGNSWSYLIQAADCRNWGTEYCYGYRYFDGERLAMIGLFKRPHRSGGALHFHVIRPVGEWTAPTLENLCACLRNISGQPVYIKKLTAQQRDALTFGKFRPAAELPWHHDAPLEDDTYPEVILDLHHTLSVLTSGDNELRRKYRRFRSEYGSACTRVEYSTSLFSEAWTVINQFFESGRELSKPENYFSLLETLPAGKQGQDYFASLYRIDGIPAAICLADSIAPGVEGIYANLTASKRWKCFSEYLLLSEFQYMLESGIHIVNLGGSETEGLDVFKNKFRPVNAIQMHWLIYD